ncbi:hypothetical protein TPHA_0E00320 [Tetrapisispora phaffii CBS 4417]|uniref:Protein ILM1 n=1 Tax=Tetrapisispora phaffii (strain ATCC 24235 / CBS 4417 / NBRC 1672 / NRRL Y-8282 / UCD 70-5) TaxID=1071381 RepID=G8BTA0_TETPH|nr:hypothetical protein TPHA_0E00320 [Tetrapisispora phaffii CBS 4417]CCE63128.1 hypothetical protein TPHA_0E00320 [Tetrapisispora phaffii CBS 4417]
MALLSSTNVLYLRIAFLSTISFFCFKNVTSILENSYFLVLTQAMNLPALNLAPKSAQLGVVGLLFALLAIDDLIPLLERNTKHFSSIVPFRLMIFFIVTASSYLAETNYYVHNNAVFIYSFIEVWLNFLIFSAIREERNDEYSRTHQFMDDEIVNDDDEENEGDSQSEAYDNLTSAQEIALEAMEVEQD